jgi:hypothetical protein
MPVQLVEQIDEVDAAGNTQQFMRATFTVGDQGAPLTVQVPMTTSWPGDLIAAIESLAGGVTQVLGLGV